MFVSLASRRLRRVANCAPSSPNRRKPAYETGVYTSQQWANGLCRLSPVPAAGWPFPTLSLRSLRGCSDPYPAALLGCMRPLLRRGHRSHPRVDGFDARVSPHMAASVGTSISRLQSFDHLRAPTLARPPGCSHRSSTIAAGRPGRSHHASPGRLPTDRDVASLHARHGRFVKGRRKVRQFRASKSAPPARLG